LDERQPGIDHRRELPREYDKVFVGDLLFFFAEGLSLLSLFDRGNRNPLRSELANSGIPISGVYLAPGGLAP
jgi:hypothetical protein